MKIGAAARHAGLTVPAVRHYEALGLLEPPRTEGDTRLYGPAHVARLRAIKALVDGAVPLERVARLVNARPGSPTGAVASRRVLAELADLRHALEVRIAADRALLIEIDAAAPLVQACLDCPNEPTNAGCPDCPCVGAHERSRVVALTWSTDE